MAAPLFRVRNRFPTLASAGVAVEWFRRYVNPRPNPHGVDVTLLTCLVRGRARHQIGAESFQETGGSVGITQLGEAHTLVAGGPGVEVANVYLNPAFPLPPVPQALLGARLALLPEHPGLVHRLDRRVRVEFPDFSAMGRLLRAMEAEQAGAGPGRDEALRGMLQVLVVWLCRQARAAGVGRGAPLPGAAPGGVERVRLRLDRRFREAQSLAALAALARMTPTSLCRAFRRHTGRTVTRYVAERRLEAALGMLRNGREKVLAVALECGFRDVSMFNRKFRALFGMTPGAYRRGLERRSG